MINSSDIDINVLDYRVKQVELGQDKMVEKIDSIVTNHGDMVIEQKLYKQRSKIYTGIFIFIATMFFNGAITLVSGAFSISDKEELQIKDLFDKVNILEMEQKVKK